MSRLARYEVELPSGGKAILNLTPEDANRRGAKPVEVKARPPARNKTGTSARSKS